MRELNEQELEQVVGGATAAGAVAGGVAGALIGAAGSNSLTFAATTPVLAVALAGNNSVAIGVGVGVQSGVGSWATLN